MLHALVSLHAQHSGVRAVVRRTSLSGGNADVFNPLRNKHGAVVLRGEKLCLMGGLDLDGDALDDVWCSRLPQFPPAWVSTSPLPDGFAKVVGPRTRPAAAIPSLL